MDVCAPCDRYLQEEWGRGLEIEANCLNCVHREDKVPCPTLSERICPGCPVARPVRGGGPESALYPCTADCGDSADGKGGSNT